MNNVELFIKNVKELTTEHKKNLSDVLSENGLNKNLLNSAKQRNTLPSAESILTLANYFNVSTDFLFGRIDIKNPPANTAEGLGIQIPDELKEEVRELIKIYITLNTVNRAVVLAKAAEEQRTQESNAAKQTTGIA